MWFFWEGYQSCTDYIKSNCWKCSSFFLFSERLCTRLMFCYCKVFERVHQRSHLCLEFFCRKIWIEVLFMNCSYLLFSFFTLLSYIFLGIDTFHRRIAFSNFLLLLCRLYIDVSSFLLNSGNLYLVWLFLDQYWQEFIHCTSVFKEAAFNLLVLLNIAYIFVSLFSFLIFIVSLFLFCVLVFFFPPLWM